MSYTRQLSDVGAALLGVFLSGVLIVGAVALYAPMTVFSPLILLISLGMTAKGLILYPRRRTLRLEQPTCVILASWALALPLTVLLEAAGAAATRLLPPDTWAWGFRPKDVEFTSRYAGVVVVVVLGALAQSVRDFVLTPEDARFDGELPRKGPILFLLHFGSVFMSMTLFLGSTCTAALFLDSLGAKAASPAARALVRVGAGLACVPAVLVALACLRRGLWMLDLRAHVDDHPRATARSAATGLVELRGKARPIEAGDDGPLLLWKDFMSSGEKLRTRDFLLDDGTGTARVRLPEKAQPGRDGVIDLVVRSRPGGLQPEFKLMSGDEVYVLGRFEPSEEGPGTIAAWSPPYGGVWVPLTKEFFDQSWDTGMGFDFAQALDLKIPGGIFALSDDGEWRLRRRLGRRAAWSFALAGILLAGAAAYLLRLG